MNIETGEAMNATEPVAHEPTQLVPLDFIAESPTNPRTEFPADKMAELTESVRRLGVLQPVLMRPWPESYQHKGANPPRFELVAGARRFRAAQAAELKNIEAKIRNLTDHEVIEIQLIENLQREDLHPMDEAHGYEQAIDHYGYTAETLAAKIAKSKAYVYARLKLTALCHDARKAFRAGNLSPSTALLIARIPIEKLQVQALKEITDTAYGREPMSVRRAQEHLQTKYMLRLVEAPFSRKDPDLLKAVGSCEACPKRTGNQPAGLFDDVQSADVCTDPDCYGKKKAAHVAQVAAEAKKTGQEVITGKAATAIAPHGTQHMHDAKLVKLDDKCQDDPKHRTYRQLLGDNAPEPKLLEDVRTGHMVPVVEKKQLAEAMKKAGIEKPKSSQEVKVTKEEKAAELEKTFRQALLANVRNELVNRMRNDGAGLTIDEARLVTLKAFTRLWDDSRKRVAKLWLPEMKATEGVDTLIARIPTMPPEELCLIQMDMSLVGEVECHRYNYDEQPEPLIGAAKRLGIDPAEIRKEVAAEAREKAKPTTQAARAAKSDARGKGAKTPAPAAVTEAPKPAAEEIKVGDRVRMNGGDEGTVEKIRGKKLEVAIEKNGVRVARTIPATYVEKLPPATQAAQAEEQTATETVIVPKEIWPFPTTGFEKNKKAAASAAKGDIEKNAKPSAEVTA